MYNLEDDQVHILHIADKFTDDLKADLNNEFLEKIWNDSSFEEALSIFSKFTDDFFGYILTYNINKNRKINYEFSKHILAQFRERSEIYMKQKNLWEQAKYVLKDIFEKEYFALNWYLLAYVQKCSTFWKVEDILVWAIESISPRN